MGGNDGSIKRRTISIFDIELVAVLRAILICLYRGVNVSFGGSITKGMESNKTTDGGITWKHFGSSELKSNSRTSYQLMQPLSN